MKTKKLNAGDLRLLKELIRLSRLCSGRWWKYRTMADSQSDEDRFPGLI